MEQLLKILVIIHVIAGTGALLLGGIAYAYRKNTAKHKKVGIIYFWCMTIVFITAIIVSIAKSLLFLFLIGIFSYYSTLIAYRSLRLKNLHNGQKPFRIDWIIEIVAGITFLGMMTLGIFFLTKNNIGGTVPLAFGIFGVLSVRTNIKLFTKGPKETLYWYKKHIGHMIGSYIGSFTAFLVNQAPHLTMIHPTLLWFLPTFIIVPIMIMEMKKVKTTPIDA